MACPCFTPVALVDQHARDAEAGKFNADSGFLANNKTSGGCEVACQVAGSDCCHAHGGNVVSGLARLGSLGRRGRFLATGGHTARRGGEQEGNSKAPGPWPWVSVRFLRIWQQASSGSQTDLLPT